MPAKLIGFILMLLIIVTFIGFNIENSSDIRVWFGENGLLKDVPIFVSFFCMYLIGVLSAVPFVLRWRSKKKKNAQKKTEDVHADIKDSKRKKKKRIMGSGKEKDPPEENIDTDVDGNAELYSSENSQTEDD